MVRNPDTFLSQLIIDVPVESNKEDRTWAKVSLSGAAEFDMDEIPITHAISEINWALQTLRNPPHDRNTMNGLET